MSPGGRIFNCFFDFAGRSAIVGDGDDSGDIAGILLQSAQHRGKPGAAANDDDSRSLRQFAPLIDHVRQPAPRHFRAENAGQRTDQAGEREEADQRSGDEQERGQRRGFHAEMQRVDAAVRQTHGKRAVTGDAGLDAGNGPEQN